MANKSNWRDINDPVFFKNKKMADEEARRRREEQDDATPSDSGPARPVARMYEPRWYHTDPARAQECADAVLFGDEIMLEINLGNTHTGDGKRFKGRGLIQLTGRANYTEYGKENGKNYTTGDNPGLISTQALLACDVAGWFWEKNSLNNHADKDDVTKITKVINGGLNGFDDRKRILKAAKGVLNVE